MLERLDREHGEATRVATRSGPSPLELEQAANEARAHARAAATERDDVAERARATRERLAALERSLESREGIPPAARTLGADGEQIALAALEVEPGFERAIAAALAWRASAVLAKDPAACASSCSSGPAGRSSAPSRLSSTGRIVQSRRLRSRVCGRCATLPPARTKRCRLLDGIWLVDDARLVEPSHGVVVTQAGHGYDADRGELWFAGTTAEAIMLELDARRRTLADEVVELDARAGAAAAEAEEAAAAAATAEAAFAEVAHLRERVLDVESAREASPRARGRSTLSSRASQGSSSTSRRPSLRS